MLLFQNRSIREESGKHDEVTTAVNDLQAEDLIANILTVNYFAVIYGTFMCKANKLSHKKLEQN